MANCFDMDSTLNYEALLAANKALVEQYPDTKFTIIASSTDGQGGVNVMCSTNADYKRTIADLHYCLNGTVEAYHKDLKLKTTSSN